LIVSLEQTFFFEVFDWMIKYAGHERIGPMRGWQ